MSSELALLGGSPVVAEPLRPYPSVGDRELEAVAEVIRSGRLSGFYGTWGDHFFGGPSVKRFETAWAERFETTHAVSVNSASSGLLAAMGAAGVGPGDEVIMPPYTMSATAMAPLFYGGVPVFADIDPQTFCLSVDSVRAMITDRTRAIIAVNLFGHPAPLMELRAIADELGLVLVEDNAQSPTAKEHDRFAGTIGHIGVFSLNYHKHIHAGEGGVCVTDDDEMALRLQLIRNHGENALEESGVKDPTNIVGLNLRMTEISAAVALAQLSDVDAHVLRRRDLAETLTGAVDDLVGLTPPSVSDGCTHVYYVWAIRFDEAAIGVTRDTFSRALTAEGFPHFVGYVEPLYMLPLFQRRIAIGRDGFPFTESGRRYERGMCPETERAHSELIGFEACAYDVSGGQHLLLADALRKVYAARDDLALWEKENPRESSGSR